MEFLNPAFLVAAGAVAVPILLHLFHRRVGSRRVFPALRYLRRTEREHASRIRLRQLILLFLRAAAVVLLVLAGSRLVVGGLGREHEPTALAVVLDNSMSTGMVVGDGRVLDALKDAALVSVDEAGPDDRLWVLRAGEPWETPVPGGADRARDRVRETVPAATRAELTGTVRRARRLVADAGMPAAEVHLFTDLQASSWTSPASADRTAAPSDEAGLPPVFVYHPDGPAEPNRWISRVRVGGGLAPLVNQRTEVGVTIRAAGSGGEPPPPDTVRVRLILDGRVAAAVDAPPGEEVLIPAGPFPLGSVTGSVEIDPDPLRDDDRRYLAFRVRPPPRLGVGGDPGFFVTQALSVLDEAGRIRRESDAEADVLVAPAGAGLAAGSAAPAAVLLPPSDPALLPAMNQRLRDAGIPWRLESEPGTGEIPIRVVDLPISLSGVSVRRAYRLVSTGAGGTVRARRETGEPWLVTGRARERPYLLLASPLVPEATSLPLTVDMLPVVEWMVSGWAPGVGSEPGRTTGEPLALPAGATGVRDPEGTLHPVDGTLPFRDTGQPGIYEIVRADTLLELTALNPPSPESRLDRLGASDVARHVASPVRAESDVAAWSGRIFASRRGGEVWRPLLLAALAVLVAESVLAAGGRGGRARGAAGARPEEA